MGSVFFIFFFHIIYKILLMYLTIFCGKSQSVVGLFSQLVSNGGGADIWRCWMLCRSSSEVVDSLLRLSTRIACGVDRLLWNTRNSLHSSNNSNLDSVCMMIAPISLFFVVRLAQATVKAWLSVYSITFLFSNN